MSLHLPLAVVLPNWADSFEEIVINLFPVNTFEQLLTYLAGQLKQKIELTIPLRAGETRRSQMSAKFDG